MLYPEATARIPSDEAGFLLNLNTGPRMDFRVDEDPGAIERHWFPLGREIVRTSGVALTGPPPEALFAPIPRAVLLPVVRESLEWYRAAGHSGGESDVVLNACRSLRWFREDAWSSKSEAGAWALEHTSDPELVAAALDSRRGGPGPGPGRVARFVDRALAELSAHRL